MRPVPSERMQGVEIAPNQRLFLGAAPSLDPTLGRDRIGNV
jgi:hypothetical protein